MRRGGLLEVVLDLVDDVPVGVGAMEQRAEAAAELAPETHRLTPPP